MTELVVYILTYEIFGAKNGLEERQMCVESIVTSADLDDEER